MKTLLATLVCTLCTALPAEPSKIFRSFELSDQYGKSRHYEFDCGQVTVLMIADRNGCEGIDGWVTALKNKYGSRVTLIGVADVSAVPALFRSLVRNGISKKFKHPILLDWQGTVVSAVPLTKNVANLFLLDGEAHLVTSVAGQATPKLLDQFCASIDQQFHKAQYGGRLSSSPILSRPLQAPEKKDQVKRSKNGEKSEGQQSMPHP